jgi:hypothetical protein
MPKSAHERELEKQANLAISITFLRADEGSWVPVGAPCNPGDPPCVITFLGDYFNIGSPTTIAKDVNAHYKLYVARLSP